MTYSSCLTDWSGTHLVLDTSAVINLYACGRANDIIDALPHACLMPKIAAKELEAANAEAREQLSFLSSLVSTSRIQLIDLNESCFVHYERFVSGSRSLDDGEAAVLAIALEHGFLPVLDERKARHRVLDEKPNIIVPSTIDLFLHPTVFQSLGSEASVDIIYTALQKANMSVLPEQRDTVIALIGKERAKTCQSLPRFKSLCQTI
ncbi:MAG: DNA-binding protein [Candidatus Melainabacteria bacterium]|nr:DNA-binding protein [Candidatus Melainabacteria bacterium]